MFFYYFIFFLILVSLFAPQANEVQQNFIFFTIAVVLILIAGLRQTGVDNDSLTYVEVFNSVGSPVSYFKDYQDNSFYEPAYYLIPSVVLTWLNLKVVWVFLTFAIIGVTIKFVAISKLTDFTFLSVLVYFSHSFMLHELTQIRAGVASGILLLCIIEIEKRNLFRFLLLMCTGILFHYSMVVFLPFYFLNSKTINKKVYMAVLFVPFILHFLKIDVINILKIFKLGVLSQKIQLYNDLLDVGVFNQINVFNTVSLIQVFLCSIFVIKSDLLFKHNRYALLLVKIYCFASASLVIFSNIPVLAIRISELLYIVQIILLPFMLYIIRPKYVAFLFVIVFALTFMSINLLYVGILRPYFANY